jgi:hypothetical protein
VSSKPGTPFSVSSFSAVVRDWLPVTAMPSRAMATAGASRSDSGIRRPAGTSASASSQPSTVPGTVRAASAPRVGSAVACPRSAYHAGVASAAARPQPEMPTGGWPGRWISQKPSPPMPFMCG